MPDNTITLVGNVTEDPELRFTPSGRQVANFTVAVNRRFKNNEGAWDDRLDGFFRCNVWGEMAENVAETLQKGTRVVLTGRLEQRSWDDKEGNKRSAVEVQIDEIGPSLRWAVAQVQKSQKSQARTGGGDWGSQQSSPQGGGQGGSSWGAPPQGGGWGDQAQQQGQPKGDAPAPASAPAWSGGQQQQSEAPAQGGGSWGAPAPVGGNEEAEF